MSGWNFHCFGADLMNDGVVLATCKTERVAAALEILLKLATGQDSEHGDRDQADEWISEFEKQQP